MQCAVMNDLHRYIRQQEQSEADAMAAQALADELWSLPMIEVFARLDAASFDTARPPVSRNALSDMASQLESLCSQAAEYEI